MFKRIYFFLPYFLQCVLLNIRAILIQKRRFGRDFHRIYQGYLDRSHDRKLDQEALRDFLINANKSSFWSERFLKFNVNLNSKRIAEELQKLPILSKKEVKENWDNILIPTQDRTSVIRTSGTTGSGMAVVQTRTMENHQWAVWWRYRRNHGLNINDWCAWFGGQAIISPSKDSPPYWITNYPMRLLMMSLYHLNENTVENYYLRLKKSSIKWLHGYPSQLSYFASLVRERKLGSIPSLEVITTGSETLLDHQKEIIEDVFKVKVWNHYGLTEGVSNISQDTDGSWLLDQDFAFTEFHGSVQSGMLFKIIGTNYRNWSFPLIRYDTGDLAYLANDLDTDPKVLGINGRIEDYITLSNGAKIGRLDHMFKGLDEIIEAQIIQKDLTLIEVRVVKGEEYDSSDCEKRLLKEINFRLGNQMQVELKYCKGLSRTPSGKLKFVISELS